MAEISHIKTSIRTFHIVGIISREEWELLHNIPPDQRRFYYYYFPANILRALDSFSRVSSGMCPVFLYMQTDICPVRMAKCPIKDITHDWDSQQFWDSQQLFIRNKALHYLRFCPVRFIFPTLCYNRRIPVVDLALLTMRYMQAMALILNVNYILTKGLNTDIPIKFKGKNKDGKKVRLFEVKGSDWITTKGKRKKDVFVRFVINDFDSGGGGDDNDNGKEKNKKCVKR